jgi:hypothetical protein
MESPRLDKALDELDMSTGVQPPPIDVPLPAALRYAEKIELMPIRDLIPYARNAKTHSDAEIREAMASIVEFGWTNPCLIDPANELIAGHRRVLAAERLKIESVPCLRLGWLTDTQKRAYRLADNRIPQNGGWDAEMLALEMRDLQASEFDLTLLGFGVDELPKASENDPWSAPESAGGGHETPDGDSVDGQLNRILLIYQPADYEAVMALATAAMTRHQVADMSRLFRALLDKDTPVATA